MDRSVDYDQIAATYDRRYERNAYRGVERALFDFVGAPREQRILEVGCGTGYWLSLLERRGFSAAGLDASPQMLQRVSRRLLKPAIVCGRAEQLPWESRCFDRLVCINAFHHFRDKQAFLSEARRVLREKGGLMTVGLDPHTALDRWFIYEYFDGVLEFDKRRFLPTHRIRELMRASGFGRCCTIEVQHAPLRLSGREAVEQGRLDRTATSQLVALTQAEYERGINRLWRDIETAEARGERLELVSNLRLYATIGWAAA